MPIPNKNDLLAVYRGQGIYWVKGSVPVLFWILHNRGERGRKGSECKFPKIAHKTFDTIHSWPPVIISQLSSRNIDLNFPEKLYMMWNHIMKWSYHNGMALTLTYSSTDMIISSNQYDHIILSVPYLQCDIIKTRCDHIIWISYHYVIMSHGYKTALWV